MPAYVLAHIDVTDPENYQEYIRMSPESIVQYGGRFLARGPAPEVLEGTWVPKRLVLHRISIGRAGAPVVGVTGVRGGEGKAPGHVDRRSCDPSWCVAVRMAAEPLSMRGSDEVDLEPRRLS